MRAGLYDIDPMIIYIYILNIVYPFMFRRFATKESATHAIVAVHNSDINGQPVKCSWGKESGEPIVSQNASQVCSSQVNISC